jgi:ADP-ribose pyrophosphatase
MAEEQVISSEYMYRGRAVNVRKDIVRMSDGRETVRDVVEHNEVIAVVPVESDGTVILENQYRYSIDKNLLEIPAGGIDGDETPEEAVIREMQEETGYRPETVVKLCGFYSSPGFCTEYMHLFLATDLVPGRLHAEDTDDITLVRIRPDDIKGLIESGEIRDAKSIAGLLYWLDYRASN